MRTRVVLWTLAVVAVPMAAGAHDGNTDPTMVHACVGNVSQVARIVGVDGTCVTTPAEAAETAMHWTARPATVTSFEELVHGLPCTLPSGSQKAIKFAISKTGAVSLNCGDPPRYVDNEDGTVTDVATGLIWLKQADCLGSLDYTTEALPAVAALAHGTCGLTDGSKPGDWRLPTAEEFSRVTRAAAQVGCINTTPEGRLHIAITDDSGFGCYRYGSGSSFVGVESGNYLAAALHWADGRIYYPLIDLLGGGSNITFPYSVAGLVWPVRQAVQ